MRGAGGLLTLHMCSESHGVLDAIREGLAADLVIFDPDTVADSDTFEAPHRSPVGIHYVLVNGQIVIKQGEHTGRLPGAVLKKSGPDHDRDIKKKGRPPTAPDQSLNRVF